MKKSYPTKKPLLSMVMLALVMALSGCFSLPEGPCPIGTLLIDQTALPAGILKETGDRSADDAPARVGIEKIGTSFSSFDQGGLVQAIYRFWDKEDAQGEFEDVARYYFIPRKDETDWITPSDLAALPVQADRYKIACSTIIGKDVEICQFVAQYAEYVTYLSVDMIALDHDNLLFIVQDIDRRFVNCVEEK